ncbi:MAG: endolytic transglycosylase MltG [Desulfobulbales bacterium]|nr:endolytic transglycosylase MltG [Desulfobulbales bacterium]
MTFPGFRISAWFLLLPAIPLLFLLWIWMYAIGPGPASQLQEIEVFIPARTGVSAIGKILAEHKVIKDDPRFAMLVTLSGAAGKLRAGEYAFVPGKRPLDVIELLKQGRVLYRPVTIPEGTAMAAIADILAAGGWVDRERFTGLLRDPELLAASGIAASSLEGYLFPDTYYLSRGQQDETGIIRMMLAKHFQVYEDIMQTPGIKQPSLSHHEIVTLASIVEKETGNPQEHALVAAVFLNRLAKGMRLQADPTVRYGLERVGPITVQDLNNSTPDNTYIRKGLPPGPIANPGRAAIEAVFSPADTDYLYFVSKDGTSHYFSRTLEEHNRAVKKYRDRK